VDSGRPKNRSAQCGPGFHGHTRPREHKDRRLAVVPRRSHWHGAGFLGLLYILLLVDPGCPVAGGKTVVQLSTGATGVVRPSTRGRCSTFTRLTTGPASRIACRMLHTPGTGRTTDVTRRYTRRTWQSVMLWPRKASISGRFSGHVLPEKPSLKPHTAVCSRCPPLCFDAGEVGAFKLARSCVASTAGMRSRSLVWVSSIRGRESRREHEPMSRSRGRGRARGCSG
jgi:hypothetical protein